MSSWRKILWPFSLIYGSVMALRNKAFDLGALGSQAFEVPVISVGNLSTGGTGKTPMVEYILRKSEGRRSAVVSRGYGRKTKGYLKATRDSSYLDIGDEPLQIYNKFPEATVVVSEKRVEGIQRLLADEPDVSLIVLDDAYQHRYVDPGLKILLTTHRNPYYRDMVLPAGNLREWTSGRKRADVIVVTKCPSDLDEQEATDISKKIGLQGGQSLFFSTLKYGEIRSSEGQKLELGAEITLLSGIANPRPLRDFLKERYTIIQQLQFPDHHSFSASEIEGISALQGPVVTTEKDFARLKNSLSPEMLSRLYIVPVSVEILFGKDEDLKNILKAFASSFDKKGNGHTRH